MKNRVVIDLPQIEENEELFASRIDLEEEERKLKVENRKRQKPIRNEEDWQHYYRVMIEGYRTDKYKSMVTNLLKNSRLVLV